MTGFGRGDGLGGVTGQGGRAWGADGVWQVDNRMIADRSGRGGMVDDPWPQ